jgi:hypothetical protein
MKNIFKYILVFISIVSISVIAKAQSFEPQISKDSLTVLKNNQLILKASLKIHELKIQEANEEEEAGKLLSKLLVANNVAKESAIYNSKITEGLKGAQDIKAVEKAAKKVKSDTADAQKALERFNKQLKKIDDLKSEIRNEERRILEVKPKIIFWNQ